jgi:ribonuclease HII
MAVLVGIDEAGFGPILGPLVVSSSTFSLADDLQGQDLWQILHKSLAQTRRHLRGRLLVTDSKKAHSKSTGLKHLERTVLSSLSCLGHDIQSLAQLLAVLCPDCLERLGAYPWYQDLQAEAWAGDDPDKAIAASVLQQDMAQTGAKLLHLESRCLDVAHYNALVATVRNKSNVLFTQTCALIQNVFDAYPEGDLHVVVDRQGGRVHYRDSLLRMFPGMGLRIASEDQDLSAYVLSNTMRSVHMSFRIKAEAHSLPVALASMASKYVRELLMGQINRYFQGLCPDLKATAGYWQDGQRFIKDLRDRIPETHFGDDQLIRSR